ncbi:MAG: hypothetical protein Q7J38_13495 [Gallionella sp.]|nr:hypothetical protein [Gallionella sp.]
MARHKLIAVFAWLQLFISIVLAATVIWGYTTYRTSFGQIIQSVAASIMAVSNVVGSTADTIEANQILLDKTSETLSDIRSQIKVFQGVAEFIGRSAPQYEENLRVIAGAVSSMSGTVQSIGDGLMFTAPTGITWQGIVMSRPLEAQAQAVRMQAQNIKGIGENLLKVSATIGQGKNISLSFTTNSEQTLKWIEKTEKTLAELKSNDLPKALVDLKAKSDDLSKLSKQVNIIAGNISEVFLVVGLLLAGLCFFNSLSLILLQPNSKINDTHYAATTKPL